MPRPAGSTGDAEGVAAGMTGLVVTSGLTGPRALLVGEHSALVDEFCRGKLKVSFAALSHPRYSWFRGCFSSPLFELSLSCRRATRCRRVDTPLLTSVAVQIALLAMNTCQVGLLAGPSPWPFPTPGCWMGPGWVPLFLATTATVGTENGRMAVG